MIEEVKKEVEKILDNEHTGHGMKHVNSVLKLSLKFAKKEKANKNLVALIALLHEVDDHKLFGLENSKNLINTKSIMNKCNIDINTQNIVCEQISLIGYSKRLANLKPTLIEGKIVSDADMCDALGANGLLRIHEYIIGKNRVFFDRNVYPIKNINDKEYIEDTSNGVCHIFEKILKLKDLMLTDSGKTEAQKRNKLIIDFLYEFFYEEDAKEWIKYLNKYIKK